MSEGQEDLREKLRALGFDAVRFVRLGPVETQSVADWVAAGMHADMHWYERSLPKRHDPSRVLENARSAIVLGVNYWPGPAAEGPGGAERPQWARYTLYSDYHDTIKTGLVAAGRLLEQACGVSGSEYRYYVDTGPVLERGWAARGGLGFLGKNGMLISREYGNWLFLAAIFTTVDFSPDEPLRGGLTPEGPQPAGLLCGRCTRCITACPTGAIVRPGVVDARKCVSYQTIENKGIIPRELRPGIGAHIYGCDVCLDVCPWNRFAKTARSVLLESRPAIGELSLREILSLTPDRFASVFRGTGVKRLKLSGLLRNACVVAANTRATDCIDVLVTLASHPLAMVRAHAVWAIHVLAGTERAARLLATARAVEEAPEVLAEYEAASQAG